MREGRKTNESGGGREARSLLCEKVFFRITDGIPRCSPALPLPFTSYSPLRLAFVGGVWIGIVVTICQAPTPGCSIALVDGRIAANVRKARRAKRLISPEIHTAIPDNRVENFITPARDSAIEWRRRRGRREIVKRSARRASFRSGFNLSFSRL